MKLFLLCFHFFFSFTFSLSSDGLALLSLKSAVDQSGNGAFSDWNGGDSYPCGWSGISCANISGVPEPRVVGIALAGKSLRGYIPSELGTLRYLRRLNLHDNEFYGVVPVQLFNATALHSIFLHRNNLSGPFPASICTVPRLQNLDLSDNSFSGSIPNDVKKCTQIQRLILARNKFSGEIPAGVWSELDNLIQLDLSANDFKGPIPEDIGELHTLSGTLNLSFNHLSGRIPNSLGKLSATVNFDLRNNDLIGEIPQTGTFSNQGPTAFLGNKNLCGLPLRKSCTSSDRAPGGSSSHEDESRNRSKGLSPGLIILISAADVAGVALVGLVIVYVYWKKKDDGNVCSCIGKRRFGDENEKENPCTLLPCMNNLKNDEDGDEGEVEVDGGGKGEGELVTIDKGFRIELDELLKASAYVLGKSALGIVYKVVLGNGMPVAVRRLGEGGEERYKEFVAEVQAIGKVKHPNIVRLRAYYWAHDEKLLISDFISNGNLGNALRGRNGQPSSNLSWSTRLRIAKGIARGLSYLHEFSPRKFVHGDIKPTNILLDNDLQPYISDFGLNRLISITGNNPSTGGFMGGALPYYVMKSSHKENRTNNRLSLDNSRGCNNYKAPEARVPGCRPTQKWDVYSLGVVLLELLTGKSTETSPTSASSSASVEVSDLVRWVRNGFDQESPLSEMVDPSLLQEVRAKKEVLSVFHVALACTEGDPEVRPRMKTVSENLEKIGR
ncbi:receptor protein kinase protein ZAR1 [Trifolium repens]|nr:receptor protein kinase protein ZAR1 [Trifolium repens]